MQRRFFLQMAAPLAGLTLGWRGAPLRLVLRGGRCFRDGFWRVEDIGVDQGGRLRFGPGLQAPLSLDVSGKVVAPGFIDILADHGAGGPTGFGPFEKYKLADGVTTALQMHGGSSEAAWFYRESARLPHPVNYGVSTFVMRIRGTVPDLRERLRAVERNLAQGALGVSHSLEYQPTPYREVLQYARLARKYDRPLVLHLRYSSAERELDGVTEAVRLAEESGAPVHIGHLHSTGGTYRMEAALELIRGAIERGVSLTACIYPYSFWATYLSSRRFDEGWRERYRLDYQDLVLVGTGERLTAESFSRYRKSGALVAVPEGTMPLDRTVDLALQESFCMIGSDGGIQREVRPNSHPRGAGCFATALSHGLRLGIPLERLIEKMTLLPRALVRPALDDRGILVEGALADLTVFDPAAVRGNATVENPGRVSSGIELVLVGGEIAYRPGSWEGRNGRPIRARVTAA